jgi:hypothetical protein
MRCSGESRSISTRIASMFVRLSVMVGPLYRNF